MTSETTALTAARAEALFTSQLATGSQPAHDVVDELDPRLLEVAVEVLDVGLVEIELGDRVGDLGEREDPNLLALGHEALDLFEFLEFHY